METTELCARCGLHPAEQIVTESAMDYIHGSYENMCGCCSAYETLLKARAAAARIPQLEADLAVACAGTGQPPPEIPWGWAGWIATAEGAKIGYWDEDIHAVADWAGAAPGRSIGGRMRRPAWVTRRNSSGN